MSGPIFVLDAEGKPLMPMAPAYARKLLRQHKAVWYPHHAFPVIQLSRAIAMPVRRQIGVRVTLHLHTAELFLSAEGPHGIFPLLHVTIDLRTDIPWRMRRRAGHRHRRRARGRYRAARRYGTPYKLRRPSRAKDRRFRASLPPVKAARRSVAAVMRWRAQAIARTIQALQPIIPLTHAAIQSVRFATNHLSSAELRQWLIDTDGVAQPNGERVGACAYCGSTHRKLEIEHVVPRSQGGSDGRHNRVLSCAACNSRKGDRTPEQAYMQLRVPRIQHEYKPGRAQAYIQQTAALLKDAILKINLEVIGEHADSAVLGQYSPFERVLLTDNNGDAMRVVAKPVARQSKQVFRARNYAHKTPLRRDFVRVGTTVKRRMTVNRALAITPNGRPRIRVVRFEEQSPKEEEQQIVLGTLCECERADTTIRGIVAAIHSSGRLTLLVPAAVTTTYAEWKRIVVSPRKHLRILSTDGVIFMRVGERQGSR